MSLLPVLVAALLSTAPPGAARLEVGQVVERVVPKSGENGPSTESFELEIPAGQRVVVFAEQSAADVRLEASWEGLGVPWRVDAPLDFDGIEVLLLPASAGGTVELTVSVALPGGAAADPEVRRAHPSRFRLWIEPIAQTDAQRARLDALGWLTAAARAWAEGEAEGQGEGRRRALDLYARVANVPSAWIAFDQGPILAAQAVYCRAVLHRLLGEHGPSRAQAEVALDAWRALGDPARLADTWNGIGLVAGPDGDLDGARKAFASALALAQELGDPFREAFVRGNLCLVELMGNRLRQGIACYEEALPSVRRIGDRETESAYLLNMAQAHKVLGEPDAALELYGAALVLQRSAGLEKLEAKTLNNLAGLHLTKGDLETAREELEAAAALFERLGDVRWQGRSLHNLANTLVRMGDAEAAVAPLERALEIHRSVGHRAGEASALKILGQLAMGRGDTETARASFAAARELETLSGDVVGAALAESYLARLDLRGGAVEAARARLVEAVDVLRAAERSDLEAGALLDLGLALVRLGRWSEGRAALERALDLYLSLDDSLGRGAALLRLSTLEAADPAAADGGREEVVLERLRQSTEAFDTVTLGLEDPDRRALFAGSRREAHERYLARLVAAGRGARAIEVSESARTWGLRSILGRGALTADESPTLDEIRSLLDDETMLLHFLVGDEASHLFVIGVADFEVVSLPPRAELEDAVRRVRSELTRPGRAPTTLETELSAELLQGAWHLLDRPGVRRLALALDGPLHYLPFAALPPPGGEEVSEEVSEEVTLVDRFQLVHIPSAAVLALERQRRAGRSAPEGFAAVLADPIFSAGDLRLPTTTAAAAHSEDDLVRLRWSRREAAAVVEAAGPLETLVALDAAADRDWLLEGPLDRFRFVHLATHALVDDAVPARSGLALSAFDTGGTPRDGFVSSKALRRLDLRAELVMLAACRTALGREVKGEGLVGLVQAFLEAGAARVVASLWSVPDRATAELVAEIYPALAEGARPAEALRRAQLALRDRGHPPADWAGFVLVGDWR